MGGAGDIHCLFRILPPPGKRGLSGHSRHYIWGRGHWARSLDGAPFPRGCLTWWKGSVLGQHVHIVLANCTRLLKEGYRHLWDPCSRLRGSLDSTSSGHLFVMDGDMQSCTASLGVLSKWHKGSHFVGLRRQP